MNTLVNNYKQIYDSIHGFIWISNLSYEIINTPYFQRLKSLKQLGPCHYVYPTATHTRFEHSIGTYYLAGRILKCIKNGTNNNNLEKWLKVIPELRSYYFRTYYRKYPLDDYVCELIKIAALCHDIGHGPFSHLFDDLFLPNLGKGDNPNSLHEDRSCIILQKIINDNKYLKCTILDPEIKFIQNLINPPKKSFGFVYQIVSNKLNDLDVDKYDYIARDTYNLNFKSGINYLRLVDDVKVINNIICYPEQIYHDIAEVFRYRYRLHKQVYSHKAVINIQFMILDLMNSLDKLLGISNSIDDLDKFINITDEYIFVLTNFLYTNISKNSNNRSVIEKAKELLDRINNRDLYKNISVIVTHHKLNIDKEYIINIDPVLNKDDIIIHKLKMGFVSGNKQNPLDSIFFYSRKYPEKECFHINKTDRTIFLTDNYQEHVTMIFSKNKNKDILERLKKVSDIINQMKDKLT